MREQQTYVINKNAILHVNRDESYMTDISRYLDCDIQIDRYKQTAIDR